MEGSSGWSEQIWPWLMTILAGIAVVLLMIQRWRTRNEPPGPWGLPVLGYLPFLGMKMDKTINKLAQRYGEVFQLKMGSRKVVVISGDKAIREALLDCGTTFAGRPDFYSYVITGSFGFANFSPFYRLYKKNTMKTIGEFIKVRQKELQDVAQNSAMMFLREIKSVNGKSVDPQPLLYRVACAIIGYICYGKMFDVNDKDITKILDQGKHFGEYVAFGIICDFLPWAKFLMRKKLHKFELLLKEMTAYSGKIIDTQVKGGSDGKTMTEIFSRLGECMTKSEKAEFKVDDATIRNHIQTMFGSGFGTVAASLKYGFMMMALYPDIQMKVQDELDRVIGKNRLPDIDDKESLPYTLAVVTENYRYYSMSALGVTHATTCDTIFREYSIAKDTPVIFNYYSINRGEDIFKNANKYHPERFINEDGSFDTALANRVVPFGLGQRRCAGEQLARLEVFLFFATILQQCVIEQSPDHPLDLENYIMTFGRSYKPFKVIIQSRIEG